MRYIRPNVAWILLAVLLAGLLLVLPGSSTRGQEPPPTPTADPDGWRTYNDDHFYLTYTGTGWAQYTVASASGGTLTGCTGADNSLTVRFQGDAVRVIYSKGPEGQNFNMHAGGISFTPINYAADYGYGYEQIIEGLPAGEHTLSVGNAAGALWIEAIQVHGVALGPPDFEETFPDYALVFSDDFESTDTMGWWTGETGMAARLVSGVGGQVLQMAGDSEPLYYAAGEFTEQVIRAQVQVSSGAARLGVRGALPHYFMVSVGVDGQVALLCDEITLASATVTGIAPGVWLDVWIETSGNTLTVWINGQEVLQYENMSRNTACTLVVLPDLFQPYDLAKFGKSQIERSLSHP